MPFIDTSALEVIERLPGWYGRYFHSSSGPSPITISNAAPPFTNISARKKRSMKLSKANSNGPIDGVKQVARPGLVGVVPTPTWLKHSPMVVPSSLIIS